jgi:hypothetical protein
VDAILGGLGIGTRVKLERELGRPVCGIWIDGVCCSLEPGHENPLHSGDLQKGGTE